MKWLLALTSAALGLLSAELAASGLDRGAFPYLNMFVDDARYGVRLAPSSSSRLRSREGRVTEIRTNSVGLRGPEQGPVVILGDSQMLGYGVELGDTTATWLSSLRGVEVVDAATPTWGPHEYALWVEGSSDRPKTVIFVANLANDWSEASAPNVRRHQALDGWVVPRREDEVVRFPGRAWLMGRSHLVFAARGLRAAVASDMGTPAIERLISELGVLSRPRSEHRSRLTPYLARVIDACQCLVIAAVLPIDVMVHADEWKKYRRAPIRMDAVMTLTAAFLADAAELGAIGVDLLPPLVAASPGAFLSDDPHLSPRGHEAVARALSEVLP